MRLHKPVIFILLLFFFSCQKEEVPPEGYEVATLKNLTGVDGCGFVFELENNKILEPTNIHNFLNTFEVGKKYWIKYELNKLGYSICMVGDVVNIIELKSP
jgi:hypothetical protein